MAQRRFPFGQLEQIRKAVEEELQRSLDDVGDRYAEIPGSEEMEFSWRDGVCHILLEDVPGDHGEPLVRRTLRLRPVVVLEDVEVEVETE